MKSRISFAALATIIAVAGLSTTPAYSDEKHKHGEEKKQKEEPAKEEAKPYKLETCIVSDEKLGEMGKPVVFVHKGQEIKLCCKDCRKDFDKDPEKYLKKLEEKK